MAYVSKSAKELNRKWPITSGLIAGSTKQEGRISNLVPKGSNVLRRYKVGIK